MATSPLTPASKNAFNLNQAHLPSQSSPLGLSQKTPNDPSPAKSNISSSPFSTFSPASLRGSRFGSPRKSDFDGDIDMLNEGVGDESINSNFSDFTAGQYRTSSQGYDGNNDSTPKRSSGKSRPQTPTTVQPRSSTPTPRATRPRSQSRHSVKSWVEEGSPESPHTPTGQNQTTNLIMDFTQQFEAVTRPAYQSQQTPTHRRKKSSSPAKSPSKHPLPPQTPTESRFFNLLDFSPGPTVTPRSAPTITPREMDDMKAEFQAQITKLQAQLSGREAEVNGLREAVNDSQARCADLSHSLKEQQNRFDAERDGWMKVKVEMGELFEAEKADKESLHGLLHEKEQVVENLHAEFDATRTEITLLSDKLRDSEAEAKKARDEVMKMREEAAAAAERPASLPNNSSAAEVERVARELHALYKAKHETKVTALKKSYESRWEKKVSALQTEVTTLKRKNEELQHELRELEEKKAEDFTGEMSFSATPGPAASATASEEMGRLKREVEGLRKELEEERVEKSELIASVEELLALQGSASPVPPDTEDRVRGRMGRMSGVGVSGSLTPKHSTSSSGLRSGIERMGNGGGYFRDRDRS